MNIKGTICKENHGRQNIYFNCPVCGSFTKFVIFSGLYPVNDKCVCTSKNCNSYYSVRVSTSQKNKLHIRYFFIQTHSEFLVKLRYQELI